MILMKLRDYLQEKRAAGLTDVAWHFDIPESAAQSMLEHWVRKGCVAVDVGASCSSGCGGCNLGKSVGKNSQNKNGCGGAPMIYRWREDCDSP
ncbi:MAG: FeoC-like transcriptional regulator [Burkholderiales bacterium]|jgi:hypothetical protein|nr:FeoC-like transcriptional regulator [Burkholderiales bacterium]